MMARLVCQEDPGALSDNVAAELARSGMSQADEVGIRR